MRGLVLALAAILGCTAVDPDATILASCPDAAGFTHVSPYLEKGCGTLDCHGAVARPLRVYGKLGLRLDPVDLSGGFDAGDETTDAERDANRRSLCSLEPELMAQVVAGSAAPESLLVVEKARGEVHHKGKQLVRKGDAGDACITSWLGGSVDAARCDDAVKWLSPSP